MAKIKEVNIFTEFFLYCSGSNKKVLKEQCHSEIPRHSKIGALILMTSIFAFLSMTYALFKVINIDPKSTSFLFHLTIVSTLGLLWAILIFFLDRYMVSSMKKNTPFFYQVLNAIPRFLIAIIIALTISKPIEVKLFEKRIERKLYEIREQKTIDDTKMTKEELDLCQKKTQNFSDSIGNKMNEKKKLTLREKKLINDEELLQIQYEAKQNENSDKHKLNEKELNKLNSDLKEITESIKKLQNDFTKIDLQETDSLQNGFNLSKIEFIERQISSKRTERIVIQDRINQINQKNTNLNKEVDEAYRKITNIKLIVNDEKRYNESKLDKEIEFFEKQLKSNDSMTKLKEEEYKSDSTKSIAVNKIAFSNHLVAQIEVLHLMIKESKNSNSRQNNFEVHDNRILEGNNILWKLDILIFCIFLLIEIAPILGKLLYNKGSYDTILDNIQKMEIIESEVCLIDMKLKSLPQKLKEIDCDLQLQIKENERFTSEYFLSSFHKQTIKYINELMSSKASKDNSIDTLLSQKYPNYLKGMIATIFSKIDLNQSQIISENVIDESEIKTSIIPPKSSTIGSALNIKETTKYYFGKLYKILKFGSLELVTMVITIALAFLVFSYFKDSGIASLVSGTWIAGLALVIPRLRIKTDNIE